MKKESESDNKVVITIGVNVINPTRREYPNQIDLYRSVTAEQSIPTDKKNNRRRINFITLISSIPIISETLYTTHNKLVRIIEFVSERFCKIVERINPRKKISSTSIEVIEKTKMAGISNIVARINVEVLSSLFSEVSLNSKPTKIEVA